MKAFPKPTRVWVNQPSKNQPYHNYHGMVGIAWTDDDGFTNIYFTHGDIHSMRINPLSLETKNSHTNIFKISKP